MCATVQRVSRRFGRMTSMKVPAVPAVPSVTKAEAFLGGAFITFEDGKSAMFPRELLYAAIDLAVIMGERDADEIGLVAVRGLTAE